MFRQFALLVVAVLALISYSEAFAPRSTSRMQSRALAMKSEGSFKAAIPAAILPFVLPVAAFAAEGTGRAFGFDDPRLIWAALAPSILIFPLYLSWSSQQDKDDFFDGYEKRRSG
mmetsp:Transcript_12676/g.12749  ORF Transcript_12676/g.12749 Transcript_12676/m.12749 type:complete len:115 (-) Transcript_12676:151-495(-)|eukprot:CAMPEP_0182426170 /NCGR_PEP_ID=MMETSP1167-20130531/12657_1 /TAXON_ID=2988 /ORGANISM="Mallomonas Sp, Strain CCMP3275" /LENGTH=114 /DNA_ID=CAMNT_0024607417 /DNA_START=67 /DNA_END=411 /DNA_ORIENTATION=+